MKEKFHAPKRAANADKPRIHVQAKIRTESFALVQKTRKKHDNCSVSEAIDILLYELATA